jgi:hypothetical protein
MCSRNGCSNSAKHIVSRITAEHNGYSYLFRAMLMLDVGAFRFFVAPSCCDGSLDMEAPPALLRADATSAARLPAAGFSAFFLFGAEPALDMPSPAASAVISPILRVLPLPLALLFEFLCSSKSESTWVWRCFLASIASLLLSLLLAMSVSCIVARLAAASRLEVCPVPLVGALFSKYAQCVKLPRRASSETSDAI